MSNVIVFHRRCHSQSFAPSTTKTKCKGKRKRTSKLRTRTYVSLSFGCRRRRGCSLGSLPSTRPDDFIEREERQARKQRNSSIVAKSIIIIIIIMITASQRASHQVSHLSEQNFLLVIVCSRRSGFSCGACCWCVLLMALGG